MTRALLTAATIGTLTGLALTFGPHGAVGIAVCAAGVIAWYLVAALRDRRVTHDRRRVERILWEESHRGQLTWVAGYQAPWIKLATDRIVEEHTTYRPSRALTVIKGGKERKR